MRHKFNALFSSSSSSSFSSSLHFSFLFVLLLVVCYSPAFCFASSSPSTSSAESFDESDYNYYYYDYGYNNNNNNQTTPPCSEQCTDFGNNSAACLKSCDTCGYDTTQGQCIFIAVGSWGCPDGGDNVILGQGVSNSCTNDALTACDVVTAGFFLANCVSGGLYLFTFWSFVWVARSSGRYDSLLKYTVATALINIAAFIPLAVVLYVYVYCTAGKVVFIANAVISLTCWIITLFRSCGWYPLNGETDEADTLADRDEKSVQMPARSSGAAARQTQLKQVNIVPTAAASEAEAEGEIEMTTHTNPTATETAVAASGTGGGGVGAGAVQRIGRQESAPVVAAVPNGRALALAADGRPSHSLSDSDSESNPLSVENLSMHAAAPVNMRLNADGHTPPFTATIA